MSILRIKRGTRARLDGAARAAGLHQGEPYLITDEGRLAVGTGASAYEGMAKQSEIGGSAIVEVDQTSPVYVQRTPYGAHAWTVLRGDGLRATPANNPSYATAAAAWAARASLVFA